VDERLLPRDRVDQSRRRADPHLGRRPRPVPVARLGHVRDDPAGCARNCTAGPDWTRRLSGSTPLVRALFYGYLLLIVAGLAYFIAVGALNS
jgi:hypothetical protein